MIKKRFIFVIMLLVFSLTFISSSGYQTEPKNITLKYVLDGGEGEIDFVVYKGMVDYLFNLKDVMNYGINETPSRGDFAPRP